jgi:hypothetical protein
VPVPLLDAVNAEAALGDDSRQLFSVVMDEPTPQRDITVLAARLVWHGLPPFVIAERGDEAEYAAET